MTKIDIISGFLGAGKTTLIKKLIKEGYQGEKLVLIENEFGEIGIDGGFLKEAGVNITEMNSGCICCSLVGDFGTALKEVWETYHPDRIIIEPSGVGKLSDVITAVEKVKDEVEDMVINSFSAVVDATKSKMYMKNFGEFFNNQIEHAKTIILSRTQNMKQDKLEACVALIREHNEKAAIITTPWTELDGSKILEAMERKNDFEQELLDSVCPECGHVHDGHHHEHGEHCCDHAHDDDHDHEHHHHHDHEEHHCCDHEHEHHHEEHDHSCCCGHDHHGEHHHHHHADDVFTSLGFETTHTFTKEALENILKTLAEAEEEYGIILRAKGILPNTDGSWIHFDYVPGEYEVRNGVPDYTGRLCVIGSELKEDKIKELFLL